VSVHVGAYPIAVLEGPIRLLAIFCSVSVLLGWGLFALDEVRAASTQSASEVAGRRATHAADPSPRQERDRERAHGGVREAIDDVNDVLLAPFAGIGSDDADRWSRRTVPMLLALLVYGFGLGFLARFTRGRG
jgi:hypothetical protein